jgi:hypothetical protein
MSTDLIKKYNWSDNFYQCAEFGKQFVDDQKCYENSLKIKDTHTIIKRLTGSEVPNFIRSYFAVEIQLLQIFAITPRSVGLIHKDGVDRQCAINIPIKNCNFGVMEWFSPSAFSDFFVGNDYTTIRITNEELKKNTKIDIPAIHSTVVDVPSLVNTDVWHRIDNRTNDNSRWMLSIRFKNNPTFSSMTELDYL